MSFIALTGTQDSRISEVQDRWLVFEPSSDFRIYKNPLYTVPIGQTFGAELLINTGSLAFESGTLNVKKDIHVFEDQNEARNFMTDIGLENISSISERYALRPDASAYVITEIQLVNFPTIDIEFDLLNCATERGFKLEVFASGSDGLYEIDKKAIFNANGDLISDTFLKYFEIEEDPNE